MSNDITEVDFPLTKEFDYSHKGDTVSATFIKLTAPSAKQLKHCTELKQAFYRAMHEMQKDNPDKGEVEKTGDEKLTGTEIIQMLFVSESVNMSSVLVNAIELLSSGVAMIDGEEKLTKPLIQEMSMDDLEGMLGVYLENFILRSLLTELGL